METLVLLSIGVLFFGSAIVQTLRWSKPGPIQTSTTNSESELMQLLSTIQDGTDQHSTLLDSLRGLLDEESPSRSALAKHCANNEAYEKDLAQWSRHLRHSHPEVPTRLPGSLSRHGKRVGQLTACFKSIPNRSTGTRFNVLGRQVSELRKANDRLQCELDEARQQLAAQCERLKHAEHAARKDPLTQLANRFAFDEEYAKLESSSHGRESNFCVIMIDLDHFKKINDRHGHAAGDDVLRVTGMVLQQTRCNDAFVARIGGEEFVVLCRRGDLAKAERLAENIRARINNAVVIHNDCQIKFSASMGLTQRMPGESQSRLLHRVDEALYTAKQLGRNCIHVDAPERNRSTACDSGQGNVHDRILPRSLSDNASFPTDGPAEERYTVGGVPG